MGRKSTAQQTERKTPDSRLGRRRRRPRRLVLWRGTNAERGSRRRRWWWRRRPHIQRAPESYHGDTRQRHSLVLIKAVMATEIPPLDNSFCNYVDDTLGGHFEMNTSAQCKRCALFHSMHLSIILDG